MKVKGNQLLTKRGIVTGKAHTDKTVTTVEIVAKLGDVVYSATGNSRRVTGDQYDETTGDLIAVANAIEQLHNMLQQAVSKVH